MVVCYVSGTAAIRGEESFAEADVVLQTEVTIENIAYLTAQVSDCCLVRAVRGYVKRVMRMVYPEADLLFVQADVCRSELLVEIETLAMG